MGNTYKMHYDIARIVRWVTIFEPVELKDPDDFKYDKGAADAEKALHPYHHNSDNKEDGTTETGFRPRNRHEQDYGALHSLVRKLFHSDGEAKRNPNS